MSWWLRSNMFGRYPGRIALAIACLVSTASSRVPIQIPAGKPVVLDGRLGDWADARRDFVLCDGVQNVCHPHDRSPEDCMVCFFLKYDGSNLLVSARIYDDVVCGEIPGWSVKEPDYVQDVIELFLDPDNDGIREDSEEGFQMNISPLGYSKGYGTDADGLPVCDLQTNVLPDGWVFELRIPLNELGLHPGSVFGFELQYKDNDSGKESSFGLERIQSVLRWGCSGSCWRDAYSWPRVQLEHTP